MQEKYINCVKAELTDELNKVCKNCNITTIYIGGGTPTYISSRYITELMEILQNCDADEITIEANPGTVTEEKLIAYKEAGINRISIGLQSTNDILLKKIGRIHNYKQFLETYNLAKKVGFKNINVDLMLGLPGQQISDLKESITNVVNLGPQHISVYSLILEEGTKLHDLVESKKLKLPSEEEERNMYWYTKNFLELQGYKHYEISNFAKPGFEARHNMNCWRQMEYIGIGLNSSSYFGGARYSNTVNLNKYLDNAMKR